MKIFKTLMALILLFILNSAFAEDVNNTTPQNTTVNNTAEINPQIWGLTAEEWHQYQTLMQLTPPAILGLNAQTPQEQQHFAAIVAKEEHDKLARELSFNNAVYQAMQRLYANEPVIKPFDLSPFNPTNNVIPVKTGNQK
jgi:integrating conjugative element protein (TIGR03759 family)